MLTLYYTPGTCSLAPHIALEESGARYTAVRVDFASGEQQSPAYLAINPKGRVPALRTEHGVLTEVPALLGYIAQAFPAAGLAPLDDAFAFARVQSFNSYLASTVHVAHAHGRRASRWADEPEAIAAMQRKVAQNFGDCFALIERELLPGPWVMGDTYTLCDPYLFTVAQWLESDGVDPARFPKLLAHRARMVERPAVRHALAANQP
jgi:glutathione S-transferase